METPKKKKPAGLLGSKLVAPAAAVLLAIYIVVRLFTNYTSWGDVDTALPTAEDTKASEAGTAYVEMIDNNSLHDTQIQTLWKLIQVDQWCLPRDFTAGDAPALAKELQTRAIANYQGNNLGQSASCIKMLLRWSVLILDSTGGGNGGGALQLGTVIAQTALDTVQKCPIILQHPEIRRQVEDLRVAIENEAQNHFKRELAAYLVPSEAGNDATKPKGLTVKEKLFSSRRRLQDLTEDYLRGQFVTGRKSTQMQQVMLKSWLQLCPVTGRLFAKSLKPLEEMTGTNSALLAQIKEVQDMKTDGTP